MASANAEKNACKQMYAVSSQFKGSFTHDVRRRTAPRPVWTNVKWARCFFKVCIVYALYNPLSSVDTCTASCITGWTKRFEYS